MNKSAKLPNDLHVEVVTCEGGFDALKDDWNELLNQSNQSVYFLRWSWNRLWWKSYAPLNGGLYLIVCRDGSGQLVGIAPLYWRRVLAPAVPRMKEVLFLGTGIPITTSEHLDLITRRGHERSVAETVAAFVLNDDVDRLWLSEIPITSIALPHLRRTIVSQQSLRICNRSYYVNTAVDWTTFTKGLGTATRSHLGRQTRRLSKLEHQFRCVETSEELESAMDSLVQLHQARWRSKGQPGSFALSRFEEFLRGAMRSTLAEGRLRLWTLALNEKTAAVLLGFLDNGIVHYFQGGFDPDYARYSIGTVMLGACIRSCLETEGVRQFNFMGGDPLYKSHWTTLGLDSVELEWLRPSIRAKLFQIYQSAERSGKALWRTAVPQAIRATRMTARRNRIQGK